MRIKKFTEEMRQTGTDDINTMPLMNLFVMLIPFLLITAVFVETSVFKLHLPKAAKTVTPLSEASEKDKKDLLLVLLTGKGIQIGINQEISEYITDEKLKQRLLKLKEKYKDREDVIIVSEPKIKYQKIIDVMDALAITGFSQISISGAKGQTAGDSQSAHN